MFMLSHHWFEQALSCSSGLLSGGLCPLMAAQCLSPARKEDKTTWLLGSGVEEFTDSWKRETPFDLRADILRHLGRCERQLGREYSPTPNQ